MEIKETCAHLYLVSGIQSERVRVSEQDGLPARPESSLVSGAYCHDNIHQITQQCHSSAQPQYCCSLNPVIEDEGFMHINTQHIKSVFLVLNYIRLC